MITEYLKLYFLTGLASYGIFVILTYETKGSIFVNNPKVRYYFLFVFLTTCLWPVVLLIDIYNNYLASMWKK